MEDRVQHRDVDGRDYTHVYRGMGERIGRTAKALGRIQEEGSE
jgi:hypothetical protein